MVWYLLRGFKWGKREEKEGEKRKRKEEEKGRKKGEIIDLTVVPLFSPLFHAHYAEDKRTTQHRN